MRLRTLVKIKNENPARNASGIADAGGDVRCTSVVANYTEDRTFDILENMRITRAMVSLGLEARQKQKFSTPTACFTQLLAKSYQLKAEYLDLIKIIKYKNNFDNSILGEVELDTDISRD